jgi:hypothetical protein
MSTTESFKRSSEPTGTSFDLAEQSNHLPPLLGIHRQHVDDVRPVVA